MTTDTQITKYANTLIQDMYLCGKQGVFKGYVNWFMLSYSNAVEARRQMEGFTALIARDGPQAEGPKRTPVTRHVIKTHIPDRISDVLYDKPDEPKTQDQSPLTVKFPLVGMVEYGCDTTKGTREQAAEDFMKRYTDVWGADSTATITDTPKGTLSTGTFDLTSKL